MYTGCTTLLRNKQDRIREYRVRECTVGFFDFNPIRMNGQKIVFFFLKIFVFLRDFDEFPSIGKMKF